MKRRKATSENYGAFLRELQYLQLKGAKIKLNALQGKHHLTKDFGLIDIPPIVDTFITDDVVKDAMRIIRENANARRQRNETRRQTEEIQAPPTEPTLQFETEEMHRIKELEEQVSFLTKMIDNLRDQIAFINEKLDASVTVLM